MSRIGIVGGGAFGTAMACVARRSGHEVTLWAREPEVVAAINREGAHAATFLGFAGIGDLMLTANSMTSRNTDSSPPKRWRRSRARSTCRCRSLSRSTAC